MKENKENILFITHCMSNGGAERIMSYIINNFPDTYSKHLVVDNRSEKEYECNCVFHSLGISKNRNIFNKILNNLRRYREIKKLKKELNITRSISLLDNPNILNILTRKKEKVIISIRNCKSEESKKQNFIIRYLIKKIYEKSDEIIAISEGVKLDLLNNYKIKKDIKVIYNPIDYEFVNNKSKEELGQYEKSIFNNNVVINVGRLTQQKGQWHLIRAFSNVVKEIPNAKLIILGDGELKHRLESMVENLKLSNNVMLLGFKTNVFKYVGSADVFVLSSLYEGFGNVVLEALATGTPVISTDCKYGPREILAPKTCINSQITAPEFAEYGVLTPRLSGHINFDSIDLEYEEELLADVIINMLKENDLRNRYTEKSRTRVSEFSYNEIINKWIEL